MKPAIIIAPDSFKGSLDAPAVAEAMRRGLASRLDLARLTSFPLADGGEGTLDCVAHARPGQRLTDCVAGADGRPLSAPWLLLEDHVAVLETARVIGLPALADDAPPPERRSSRGLGEQIRAALERDARRVVVGLGGSSTNDGGAGLLAALGARLLDRRGRDVDSTPAGLAALERVDLSGLDPRVRNLELVGLCDVDNPLTGARGATAVYGPQKGVTGDQVAELDRILAGFAAVCAHELGHDPADTPGAGAAGGLGFALLCLGGRLVPGADYLIDLTGLADALPEAGLVITGEGRSDAQTLQGKLPDAVARRASAAGVPVVLLSGALERSARPALAGRFDACFSIADGPAALDDLRGDAATLLERAAAEIAGLVNAVAD